MLKVHRAYRYISKTPQCDRYVLCQLNAAALDQQQKLQQQQKSQPRLAQTSASGLIAGVSPKIVKIGSMGAAIFISTETGTPFWTLFGVINAPHNCEVSTGHRIPHGATRLQLSNCYFLQTTGQISSRLQWFPRRGGQGDHGVHPQRVVDAVGGFSLRRPSCN